MEKTLFAGFWLRLCAWIIDMVIISIGGWILGFIIGFGYASAVGSAVYVAWIGNIFGVLVTWMYFAGFESSRYQATFGKRIVGIVVTSSNGKRVSFGQATVRYFAKLLSVLTVGIGFVMIGITQKKQGLHDFIAQTLVIKKGS